jgi:hypothetical protein
MNRELISSDISKADIERFSNSIVHSVLDGDLDPFAVHIRAKAVIKALEAIITQTEELAREQASRYGEKSFTAYGAKIELRDGYDSPDFSKDEVAVGLTEQLKARQDLLKQAFKLRDKAAIVDPQTGEIVPVMPLKTTKSSISISFQNPSNL